MSYFEDQGYEPVAVELYEYVYGDTKKSVLSEQIYTQSRVQPIKTQEDLFELLQSIGPKDLLVNIVPVANAPSLYDAIKSLGLQYATLYTTKFPLSFCYTHKMAISQRLKWLSYDLRAIMSRARLYHKKGVLVSALLRKFPVPRWSLMAGSSKAALFSNYPHSSRTQSVQTISNDISIAMRDQRKTTAGGGNRVVAGLRPYAVFLDSAFSVHPEFKMAGVKPPLDEEKYLKALRAFFDFLENKYDLDVVIAGHPRCEYDKFDKRFGNRQTMTLKTQQLVKDCSLVMAHVSTAVSYAVYYRKPTLFLTNDDLEAWRLICVDQIILSSWFAQSPINIDRSQDYMEMNFPVVNESDYCRYESLFLGPRNLDIEHQFAPLKQAFENA